MKQHMIPVMLEVTAATETDAAQRVVDLLRPLVDDLCHGPVPHICWFLLPNHQAEIGYPSLDDGYRLVYVELPGDWPNR